MKTLLFVCILVSAQAVAVRIPGEHEANPSLYEEMSKSSSERPVAEDNATEEVSTRHNYCELTKDTIGTWFRGLFGYGEKDVAKVFTGFGARDKCINYRSKKTPLYDDYKCNCGRFGE